MTEMTERQLNDIRKTLAASGLFSGLSPETVDACIKAGEVLTFEKGKKVELENGGLFIVVAGLLNAKSNSVTLNVFRKGSITGVSGMFSDNPQDAPIKTQVVAVKASKLLVIRENRVRELILEIPEFALRYIAFLTGRVRFLNRKMSYYTTENAVQRLAGYLYDAAGGDTVAVPVNMTKLSAYLNVGRATLYRALATLEEAGAVKKNGGSIMVISRKKLSEI